MSHPKLGPDKRKADRQQEKDRIEEEIKKIIDETVLCLEHPDSFSDEVFELEKNAALNHINEKFNKNWMYHAYNLIREQIIKANSAGFEIPIPSKLTRPKAKPPMRSQDWFEGSAQFKSLMTWLNSEKYLKKIKSKKISSEECIFNLLVHAMAYGGLNSSDGLRALINGLIVNQKPLNYQGNTYWIDLIIDNKSQPTCHIIEDNPVILKRWYPDSQSLLWIYRFCKIHRKEIGQYSEAKLWRLIKGFFTSLSEIHNIKATKFKNLKKVCHYAIGFTRGDFKPKLGLFCFRSAIQRTTQAR